MAAPLALLFASLVKKLALQQAVKDVGYGVFINLLSNVIIQDHQLTHELDAKIQALIDASFKTGLDHLHIASRQTLSRREGSVIKARDAFLQAKNIYQSIHPMNSGRAAVYVGSCSEVLEEPGTALASYEEAFKIMATKENFLLNSGPYFFSSAISSFLRFLSCREFKSNPVTRRVLLERMKPTVEFYRTKNPQGIELEQEVYPYFIPICNLLHSRGSKLPDLPTKQVLQGDNFMNHRGMDLTEQYCDIKFAP